jgi:hypothetical protein
MGGVVADAGGPPDDVGNAAKGPQLGVKALGLGALQQLPLDALKLGW